MTKTEMTEVIAKEANITKKAAAGALDSIFALITADLKKGNAVVLTGFGTFRVSAPPAPASIPAILQKRSRSRP